MTIILTFFRRAKLSAFLLFLVMLLAQFSLTYFLGNYNYISRYEDSFRAIPGIENSIYYMSGMDFKADHIQTNIDVLLNGCKGIDRIIDSSYIGTTKYMGEEVQILALDKSIIDKSLHLKLHSKNTSSKGIDDNNNLQIFITDDIYREYDLGSKLNLQIRGKPVSAVISGKYIEKACLPNFTSGGNAVSIYDIMSDYNHTIFIINTEESIHVTGQKIYNKSNLGFIMFSDDASNEDKEQITEILAHNGYTYTSYIDIIKNSQKETAALFDNTLPLPIFMFTLSTVFTISIIVLIMDKNMAGFSICFLCGLNRTKGFSLIITGFALLNIFAFSINLLFNYIMNSFEKAPDMLNTMLFKSTDIFYMLLLSVLFLIIVGMEIYILYRGKTYIQIKNAEIK